MQPLFDTAISQLTDLVPVILGVASGVFVLLGIIMMMRYTMALTDERKAKSHAWKDRRHGMKPWHTSEGAREYRNRNK